MTLSLRDRAEKHRDHSLRVDADPDVLGRARLASFRRPVLHRRRQADVADVGGGRIDDRGHADAHPLPVLAGDGLFLAQPVVVDVLEGKLEGAVVVTAVVDPSAGRGVRELVRVEQVAAAYVGRVEPEIGRDVVDQSLETEVELLAAEPRLSRSVPCCDDRAGPDLDLVDAVGAGDVAESSGRACWVSGGRR